MDISICRLCLTENDNLIDIFGEKGILGNIQKILGQHFWIRVSTRAKFKLKKKQPICSYGTLIFYFNVD